MDMSLGTAEWVSWAANWTLIMALLFGVTATYSIVVSGNVKEAALKADVATANESAGKANERAAALEKEAASLRFQLDQEIQKRAQRILTDNQRVTLATGLKGKIREINVVVQRDIEARAFAMQIEIAFGQAGIVIHPYDLPAGDVAAASFGVLMYKPGGGSISSDLSGDPLYDALKSVGLAGGTMSKPFASLELTPSTPLLPVDTYTVYVLQKSPF